MRKSDKPDQDEANASGKPSNDSEEKPEVYGIKKDQQVNPGSRREFIAKSALAGAAVSLGASGLTGCDSAQDADKIMKSLYTITTKYWYANFQFSPDSKIIAVYGSAEEDVNLYSLPDGKPLKTLKNKNEYAGVKGLSFTSDGNYLVVNVYTKINIWSVSDGTLLTTLEGNGDLQPQNQITQVALNPDGKTLAYKKYPEALIKICSIPGGEQLSTVEDSGLTSGFFCFSPDGRSFVSLFGTTMRVYSFPALTLLNTIETGEGFEYFYFNHDGKILASASNGNINLWTFPGGNLFKTITTGANYAYFKFSPDGKMLASYGPGPLMTIWSIPDGNHMYSLTEHTDKIHSIFFSADGRYFVSSQQRLIVLWSLNDGGIGIVNRIEEKIDETNATRTTWISPDSKIIASSLGNRVSLWSIPDCMEIIAGGCICDTVCTCNTVSEGNTADICTCNSVQYCTCNAICTCNAVCECDVNTGGGGGTLSYWYPN